MTNEKFLEALGARIRDVRKTKNMTQTRLAELCDIEKANLSRIESGQTNITVLTLYKIGKSLDTSVADLLNNVAVTEQVLSFTA